MVLLVQKLNFLHKHFSKLENHHRRHHHHSSEAVSASLHVFYSDVSQCLSNLSSNSNLGPKSMSLIWLQHCFEKLTLLHKAFSKLIVEIDYPISKWEVSLVEEYLTYTLNMLELLNSISSALSQLDQTLLSISHSLNVNKDFLKRLKRIEQIQPKDFSAKLNINANEKIKETISTENGLVLYQAILVLKSTGSWICSVLLSGLCSDLHPYMDIRKSACKFVLPTLNTLDSNVCNEMVKNEGIVKEFRQVNESVDHLVSAIPYDESASNVANELRAKLDVIENVLKGVGELTNQLFSEVMAGRNELLNILRQKMQ